MDGEAGVEADRVEEPIPEPGAEETWQQAQKRRKLERQKQVFFFCLFFANYFFWPISSFYCLLLLSLDFKLHSQLRQSAGKQQGQQESSVEMLVDTYVYSDLQDTKCLK